MKSLSALRRRKTSRDGPTILGVSEAVGTVLLLGISVALVGGVALWTSQLEGVEESLNVDLWSTVDGNYLTVLHRGGDPLVGSDTEFTVTNSDGSIAFREKYHDPALGRTDETWSIGEEVQFDITAVTQSFKIVVTTVKENGGSAVVLRNDMIKGEDRSDDPDLAVTRIRFMDPSGEVVAFLYETGLYYIVIEVTNFGADMDISYFNENPDLTVGNLVVYGKVRILVEV